MKQQEQPEAFEEFDFFHRNDPKIKETLRELRKRLDTVGNDIEAWAEKRGLRHGTRVVLPAYTRLLKAHKWLKILEEQDKKNEIRNAASLPF